MDSQRIIIIGSNQASSAVFNGLQNKLLNSRQHYDLLYIIDKNYFLLEHLYPQYLCEKCGLSDLSQNIRRIAHLNPTVHVLEGKVSEINFENNLICVSGKEFKYDYLVLSPDYDLPKYPFTVNSKRFFNCSNINEIINLKKHIYNTLLRASTIEDEKMKNQELSFAVIGGNKEGLEVVCSLYDYLLDLIKLDFPGINKSLISVSLIDEDKSLNYADCLKAKHYVNYNLNKRQVKLFLNSTVVDIKENIIGLSDKTNLTASSILFCGKNKRSSFLESLNLKISDGNSIPVDLYLRPSDLKNVFIVGNVAKFIDLSENYKLDLLSQARQINTCIQNINLLINNNMLIPFKGGSKLSILFLGKYNSYFRFRAYEIADFFAWCLNRVIYIFNFIGLYKIVTSIISFIFTAMNLKDQNVVIQNIPKIQEKEKSLIS